MTSRLLGVVQAPPFPLGDARLRRRPLVGHAVQCLLAVTDDVAVVATDLRGATDALAVDGLLGLRLLDLSDPTPAAWSVPAADDDRLVLHDARCPLLPVADLRRVVGSTAGAALGVRPVTDTVKTVVERSGVRLVDSTVDRDAYVAVCSPLVFSARHAQTLAGTYGAGWWGADLRDLALALRPAVEVDLVEVTPWARRVDDADELWLLESLVDVASAG